MIIEFIGVPGSGKTTTARNLAQEKKWVYIETNFWYEKYYFLVRYVLCHPVRFLQLIGYTFFQGIKTGSARIMLLKFKILASSIIATEKASVLSKKQTVILDQGLAQYGLGLFEDKIMQHQAEHYARNVVVADDVVFIQADPYIAKERLQKRGNAPRKTLLSSEKWDIWYDVVVNNSEVFKIVYETPHPHPNGK